MHLKTLLPFFLATLAAAQIPDLPLGPDGKPQQMDLAAKVEVTFLDNISPLGVTVINGHVTRLNVQVENFEDENIVIEALAGSLQNVERTQVLRNLTVSKVGLSIPPGDSVAVPYSFITNMHAQDAVLELGMLISAGGKMVQYMAYNGTISVAEPETSLLDPQVLFLYLILTSLVAGGGYLAYSTWVVPMLPKKKRTPRVAATTTTPSEAKTTGVDAAVPAGKGSFDESWIPEHHLKRPVAQKVKSSGGTPKAKTPKKSSD